MGVCKLGWTEISIVLHTLRPRSFFPELIKFSWRYWRNPGILQTDEHSELMSRLVCWRSLRWSQQSIPGAFGHCPGGVSPWRMDSEPPSLRASFSEPLSFEVQLGSMSFPCSPCGHLGMQSTAFFFLKFHRKALSRFLCYL